MLLVSFIRFSSVRMWFPLDASSPAFVGGVDVVASAMQQPHIVRDRGTHPQIEIRLLAIELGDSRNREYNEHGVVRHRYDAPWGNR